MRNMKKRMKLKQLSGIICAVAFAFAACSSTAIETGGQPQESIPAETTAATTVVTEPPVPPDSKAHIVAVGDNLIHSSIYNQAARRSTDGTYDFDYAYEHIEGLINGDINIINQETLVCGGDYEPSTYPYFNSPVQLGDKMLSLGFNVFNQANNHCLDKGVKGAYACLDYWDSKSDIVRCGMYRDKADEEKVRIMEKNGIKFSFLGFTEHTNGIPLPSDTDLQIIYTSDVEEIQKRITAAAAESDVVVVSVHWGIENSHTVTDAQRELAQNMVNWGADVILGTHPHVIQSMEEMERENGDKALVCYSLGNFISAQDVGNRMIGGAVDFDVVKSGATSEISIDNFRFVPVVTHYDYSFSNVRVYPFAEYTRELADSHGIRANSHFDYDFIVQTLKDNIPEQYLVLPAELMESSETETESLSEAA